MTLKDVFNLIYAIWKNGAWPVEKLKSVAFLSMTEKYLANKNPVLSYEYVELKENYQESESYLDYPLPVIYTRKIYI